jgi:hypothetical protein
MVIGIYGASLCIGSGKARIARNPERKHVSAPHRQRPDFSGRLRTRRFSSLAAVSEKPENHFTTSRYAPRSATRIFPPA